MTRVVSPVRWPILESGQRVTDPWAIAMDELVRRTNLSEDLDITLADAVTDTTDIENDVTTIDGRVTALEDWRDENEPFLIATVAGML